MRCRSATCAGEGRRRHGKRFSRLDRITTQRPGTMMSAHRVVRAFGFSCCFALSASLSFAAAVESLGDATIVHDVRAGSWTIAAGGASLSAALDPSKDYAVTSLRESRWARTGFASPARTPIVTADGVPHAFGSRADGFSYRVAVDRQRRTSSSARRRVHAAAAEPARHSAYHGRARIADLRGVDQFSGDGRSGVAVQPQRVPVGGRARHDPLAHRSPAGTRRHDAGYGVRATAADADRRPDA